MSDNGPVDGEFYARGVGGCTSLKPCKHVHHTEDGRAEDRYEVTFQVRFGVDAETAKTIREHRDNPNGNGVWLVHGDWVPVTSEPARKVPEPTA
jgi:hypothetical protein